MLELNRQMVEMYLDTLIVKFAFYEASERTLDEFRKALVAAEFLGYRLGCYRSIYDELRADLKEYASLQGGLEDNLGSLP